MVNGKPSLEIDETKCMCCGACYPPCPPMQINDPEHSKLAIWVGGKNSNARGKPTFMKMVEGEHNSSRRILDTLAVDLRRVLHAEQQFDYLGPILAGDQLDVVRRVADIYERKNGLMEFIVIESTIVHAERGLLGRSRQVVLVRNPKPAVAA